MSDYYEDDEFSEELFSDDDDNEFSEEEEEEEEDFDLLASTSNQPSQIRISPSPIVEIISAPEQTSLPVATPTQQQPFTFNTIGRNFMVRWLPSYLTTYQVPLQNYQSYLENIRGKYDEASNTWTFSQRNEAQVRDLLSKIILGQLPPPDLLALPQQNPIDVNAAGQLPMRTTAPPAPVVSEETPVPTSSAPVAPQIKSASVQTTGYLPSQIIQATMPESIIPLSPQPTSTEAAPQVPPYDPTKKERSESQQEYDRRLMLYRHLLNFGVPSPDADLLARMRNQVDIHGVSYEPAAMQILNTYLPIDQ